MTQLIFILHVTSRRAQLLVHPQGSHERGILLFLWRLLLVDRLAPVRVLRLDSEPASSFTHYSQDAVVSS